MWTGSLNDSFQVASLPSGCIVVRRFCDARIHILKQQYRYYLIFEAGRGPFVEYEQAIFFPQERTVTSVCVCVSLL